MKMLLLVLCDYFFMVAATEYFVTTMSDGSDCPLATDCNVLSFYTLNQKNYFLQDTIFHFLEGVHLLKHSIVVSGVSNVSLVGVTKSTPGFHETVTEPSSVITCPSGVGNIIFNNHSKDISFKYMTMKNCSRYSYFEGDFNYISGYPPLALLFHEVFNLTLDHVAVVDCEGIGLVVWNGYGIHIESSCFANNIGNTIILYSPPEKCFTNSSVYDLLVIASNFSFSRGRSSTSFGLQIEMGQKATYEIVTTVNGLKLLNNNINFLFNSDQLGYIHVNDILSMLSSYGIKIYMGYDSGYRTDCFPLVTSSNSFFVIANSNISANSYGIVQYSTQFADITIFNCSINKNSVIGLYFENDEYSAILRFINCTVEGNVFSSDITQPHYEAAVYIEEFYLHLENVNVSYNFGTGMFLFYSEILISGSRNLFLNNSGHNGGGMRLLESSLTLDWNTKLQFTNNSARKGGAIYMDGKCIFYIEKNEINKTINNITLVFQNNTALIAPDIYVKYFHSYCSVYPENLDDAVYIPDDFPKFSTDSVGLCTCYVGEDIQTSLVACYNSYYKYTNTYKEIFEYYPGQTVNMSVFVVGQTFTSTLALTDGIIELYVDNHIIRDIAYNGSGCHTVQYTVTPSSKQRNYTEIVLSILSINLLFIHLDRANVIFKVNILPCPNGFYLVNNTCRCYMLFHRAKVSCSVAQGNIIATRENLEFFGVYNSTCFIFNEECRYTYCSTDQISFNLLTSSDDQCTSGRSGLLCSQCSGNNSLLLGSNDCGECTNSWLALLIVFALAGIGLIVLIIALNLTVSIGTTNGLIFYANIIKMYEDIFFPDGPIPFVSQFISWINLDFGIKVCFINGLDAYMKSWLQFVFPIYLWLIIVVIVVVCRWSGRLTRLLGSHIVPVLSTLFLLSYVKLLRSVILVLSPQRITITCSNEEVIHQTRWFADPSVYYFEFKHTVLVAFGVSVLVLFIIPYTVVLLLSPVLQGCVASCRLCNCWNRLIPVFDAYNAPYKDKSRFWTGFLLVARLPVLVAVSAANVSEANRMWLLSVVQAVAIVVVIFHYIFGRVYRVWYLNALEIFYLLNLVLIVIAATNGVFLFAYKIVMISSVGLSFVGFIGILCLHVYLALSKGGYSKAEIKMQALSKKMTNNRKLKAKTELEDDLGYRSELDNCGDSSSSVLLKRETLIEIDDVDEKFYFVEN